METREKIGNGSAPEQNDGILLNPQLVQPDLPQFVARHFCTTL